MYNFLRRFSLMGTTLRAAPNNLYAIVVVVVVVDSSFS